jgi:hypothetical protein
VPPRIAGESGTGAPSIFINRPSGNFPEGRAVRAKSVKRRPQSAIVSRNSVMPAGTSEQSRHNGNCELTIGFHRQPSRNCGDAAGIGKPVHELLDKGSLDKDERIFSVVRPLLPDHKFIEFVEIDCGGVLTADHDVGIGLPIKLFLILRCMPNVGRHPPCRGSGANVLGIFPNVCPNLRGVVDVGNGVGMECLAAFG